MLIMRCHRKPKSGYFGYISNLHFQRLGLTFGVDFSKSDFLLLPISAIRIIRVGTPEWHALMNELKEYRKKEMRAGWLQGSKFRKEQPSSNPPSV